MKNYLEYYQHYTQAHRHWKFKMLRSKYGWSGEGKFWALNNLIGQSDNCIINLSKKAVKVSLADELQFSLDDLDLFIKFLTEECELLIFVDNKITTEIVRDNLKEVMKQRKRCRDNKNKALADNLDKNPNSSLKFVKNL